MCQPAACPVRLRQRRRSAWLRASAGTAKRRRRAATTPYAAIQAQYQCPAAPWHMSLTMCRHCFSGKVAHESSLRKLGTVASSASCTAEAHSRATNTVGSRIDHQPIDTRWPTLLVRLACAESATQSVRAVRRIRSLPLLCPPRPVALHAVVATCLATAGRYTTRDRSPASPLRITGSTCMPVREGMRATKL